MTPTMALMTPTSNYCTGRLGGLEHQQSVTYVPKVPEFSGIYTPDRQFRECSNYPVVGVYDTRRTRSMACHPMACHRSIRHHVAMQWCGHPRFRSCFGIDARGPGVVDPASILITPLAKLRGKIPVKFHANSS